MDIAPRLVAKLMTNSRRNFQSIPLLQLNFMIFKNHRPLAFKDEKELPRDLMVVHHLHAIGRHTFLDYTDIVALEQMPAIAGIAPQVMFGIEN